MMPTAPSSRAKTAAKADEALRGANSGSDKNDKHLSVLVVDDSFFMQRQLVAILESAPDLRVAGCADNGVNAIRLAEKLKPDVITMDINMPKMDGMRAIEQIMGTHPRPIVVISSYTVKGSRAALQALDLGVVDIVEKPSLASVSLDLARQSEEIIAKVRAAARVRVVRNLSPVPASSSRETAPVVGPEPVSRTKPEISKGALPGSVPEVIALGASTGGPPVLRELLGVVPNADFPPVLIVQHLPEKFTLHLAQQLDAGTVLDVVEAAQGMELRRGRAYVAPGGKHMEVEASGRIALSDQAPVHHCRPSVDVLFQSLVRRFPARTLAFVLTGMGADGAAGAVALRRCGSTVIAQDEESSLIFGMPRAAIEAGGINQAMPVEGLKNVLRRVAALNKECQPADAALVTA